MRELIVIAIAGMFVLSLLFVVKRNEEKEKHTYYYSGINKSSTTGFTTFSGTVDCNHINFEVIDSIKSYHGDSTSIIMSIIKIDEGQRN